MPFPSHSSTPISVTVVYSPRMCPCRCLRVHMCVACVCTCVFVCIFGDVTCLLRSPLPVCPCNAAVVSRARKWRGKSLRQSRGSFFITCRHLHVSRAALQVGGGGQPRNTNRMEERHEEEEIATPLSLSFVPCRRKGAGLYVCTEGGKGFAFLHRLSVTPAGDPRVPSSAPHSGDNELLLKKVEPHKCVPPFLPAMPPLRHCFFSLVSTSLLPRPPLTPSHTHTQANQ